MNFWTFVQVEDTFQEGHEKEKEEEQNKQDIKEEDNAIEMSEDFDGKMHDGTDHEPGDCTVVCVDCKSNRSQIEMKMVLAGANSTTYNLNFTINQRLEKT